MITIFNRFFILFTILSLCESANSTLVNKKIERNVDISSQLVKCSTKFNLENKGSTSENSFLISLSKTEAANLAFLNAHTENGARTLKTVPTVVEKHPDFVFYKVDFKDPLQAGKSASVVVETVFTSSLVPYPAKIQQGEKQLVEYNGNHYVSSPYQTKSQITTVTLVSSNVISYTKLKPASHSDTTITYGPYENVEPFSYDLLKVHYENNSPFLTITKLERVIELSHWGNIAVTETVDVTHTGALLKGSFSRYDYQREHNPYSSIKEFKTVLPAAAKDVYYRDEIGNISTSHMRVQSDAVELELRPRFPLFGGWKTHYTVGYNVPSYEYLYKQGDNFVMKMRILDHVFDDMVIEDLQVKVILPEGCRNIELTAPYSVNREKDEVYYTYLDTVGRPVVTMTKRNLVENHIQDFQLAYEFPSVLMLQEPLLVVVAFFLFFILVIMYVRLDLTINKDEEVEAKMRVSSYCEKVHCHSDSRAILYEKTEEEIVKLKCSKDVSQFQGASKKLIASLKEETQSIANIALKMKIDNPDYSDKITELQKHDKVLFECISQQIANAEKLVAGKMNKQQYTDGDAAIYKKKEAAFEKLKSVLNGI